MDRKKIIIIRHGQLVFEHFMFIYLVVICFLKFIFPTSENCSLKKKKKMTSFNGNEVKTTKSSIKITPPP